MEMYEAVFQFGTPTQGPPPCGPTRCGRQNITASAARQAAAVDTRINRFLHCAALDTTRPSGGRTLQHLLTDVRWLLTSHFWTHRGSFIIVLAIALLQTILVPPADADGREDRLLSITKTTVYGALLGGILGFTSALVVRDGYEDDAVRWGIVLGAFGGFAYGITSPEEDDWDDFSFRRSSLPSKAELSPPSQLVSLTTFPGRSGARLRSDSKATGSLIRRNAEVHDGGLEEKVCIEKESR